MMPKILCILLQVSFLLALAEPVVCLNREHTLTRRHIRSTYVNASPYLFRNINTFMENNSTQIDRSSNILPSQHPQQQQQQQYVEPIKSTGDLSLADRFKIFQMGPEPGVKLFNTKLEPTHLTSINGMQADASYIDHRRSSSTQREQAFKVQRTPDGKLNLVFNDYLFFQKPSESHSSTTMRPLNPDFVFPDQLSLYGDQHSKCIEGSNKDITFCTKVSKYPELTELESQLKRDFGALFGEDLPQQPENVTQRMNHDPDEEFLCDSRERIIYPEAGLTKDSNWLLIINNQKDLKQGVRVEECTEELTQCNLLNSLPNNYRSTCKQNYIYRTLVAITENGTITKDQFKLPSCCKCVLKQVRTKL